MRFSCCIIITTINNNQYEKSLLMIFDGWISNHE